jgi:formate C-acetyltransferase
MKQTTLNQVARDANAAPSASLPTRTAQSSRLAVLKEDVMRRKGSRVRNPNPFLSDIALWKAAAPGRSRVQHRAAFLLELVRAAPIEIYPGWSLAGEHLRHPLRHPEWGFGLANDLKPEDMKRLDEFGLTPEQVEAVRAVVYAWNCRDPKSGAPMTPQHYATGATTDDARLGIGPGWWVKDGTASAMVYMASGWTENHSIRDFAKVIRIGFSGIRKEVEALLNSADLADPDYLRKENFWRAALSICDAGRLLGRRFAESAAALASKADDPAERARLTRMAEVCARVPEHGARTFFEAIQALWFAHILTCGEDGINANSIGRMDQFLFPY